MFIAYVNNPNAPYLTTDDVVKAASTIVPLAQTMKTKIDSLREWARTRARLASISSNSEEVDGTVLLGGNTIRVPMTSRERNEDIF